MKQANAPGDASRVAILEPNRAGVPSRCAVLQALAVSAVRWVPVSCFFATPATWSMKQANAPGDASRVTIAEPNRGCVPSRRGALRNTDASPLRLGPGGARGPGPELGRATWRTGRAMPLV